MSSLDVVPWLLNDARFWRVAAFLFVVFLITPFVLILAVALEKPRQALRLARSWRFWLATVFINAFGSVLLAIVVTKFPPDQRLVPGLCAITLMASLAIWLQHRARRRRDRPAA